jgi:hypothetical protein
MKVHEIHSILYDLCRWNKTEKVKYFLEKSPVAIDILDDQGLFFRLAISSNNVAMLDTLLEYYKKTQLQSDSNTLEYKVAKYNIQQILQDAIDTFNVSEEIQKIVDMYIPKETDNEQDLDELEDIQLPYFSNHYTDVEDTKDTQVLGDTKSDVPDI